MADGDKFRLLIIADIHYGPAIQAPPPSAPGHWPGLGLELTGRAIRHAAARGGFDCIVLLGDLVDDGRRDDTLARMAEIRDAIAANAPGIPLLAVPGNHDGPRDKFFEVLGTRGGLHVMGGYRFVILSERLTQRGWTRDEQQQNILRQVAVGDGGPVVVLQHNPMGLTFESAPFFMVSNYEEIMRDYSRLGVMLCIAAHCHVGHPLGSADGVLYFTAPALCTKPFRYSLVVLHGREVATEVREIEPSDGAQGAR
jgi:hypothetical protein